MNGIQRLSKKYKSGTNLYICGNIWSYFLYVDDLNNFSKYGVNIIETRTSVGYPISYFFAIPYPDISGACSSTTFVQYMIGLDLKSCHRKINLTEQCISNSMLTYQYYTNRAIYGNPSTKSSFLITANSFFTMNSSNQYDKVSSAPEISAKITNSTITCSNTVSGVVYYFQTGTNTVSAVRVDLYFQNVSSNISENLLIEQFFEVKFTDGSDFSPSGSPGYTIGKPLLAGNLSSQYQAINMDKNGFYLQGRMANGTCSTIADTSEYNPLVNPVVNFGENLRMDCTLILDRDGLKNFCSEENIQNLTIFNTFNEQTFLGKFGNANINYIQDWEQLSVSSESLNVSWDDLSGTCSIPTKQLVVVYYKKAGLMNRPQNYVIHASRNYQKNTSLTWENDVYQSFTFTVEVKFENLDIDELLDKSIDYPPFFPRIPKDMFYPIWYESSVVLLYAQILMFLLLLVFSIQ